MNNKRGHWLNCARHTRSPNERTMEMASGAMLWHVPMVQISQQWLWPLRRSSGTAQKDNNISDVSFNTQDCEGGIGINPVSVSWLPRHGITGIADADFLLQPPTHLDTVGQGLSGAAEPENRLANLKGKVGNDLAKEREHAQDCEGGVGINPVGVSWLTKRSINWYCRY